MVAQGDSLASRCEALDGLRIGRAQCCPRHDAVAAENAILNTGLEVRPILEYPLKVGDLRLQPRGAATGMLDVAFRDYLREFAGVMRVHGGEIAVQQSVKRGVRPGLRRNRNGLICRQKAGRQRGGDDGGPKQYPAAAKRRHDLLCSWCYPSHFDT